MKAPAFQFYADDFIGGTCDLSQAEVGAYIRLLCYQWGRGEIPTDEDKLNRIAGGPVSADVMAKFHDGKNPRLEAERQKQADWREKCSMGGKRSAEVRRVVPRVVELPNQLDGQLNGNTPSPSPSPSPNSNLHTPLPSATPKNTLAVSETAARVPVDVIYESYPRKVGKPAALKSIQKAVNEFGFDFILDRTRQFAATSTKLEPRFIPHPATWFNQQRFNDDPSTWAPQQRKPVMNAI